MLAELLRWLLLLFGTALIAGTIVTLSRNPHWSVRMWDFPRAQIAAAALLVGGVYLAAFHRGTVPEWLWIALLGGAVARQLWKIFPYTPLSARRVEASRDPDAPRLRLLITNVKMENREHGRVLREIREADPDIVLAVETNQRWVSALDELGSRYPFVVRHPQDNWYGMVLLSRLPLHHPRIDFLVQDDIPSVHAEVELPGGERIHLHGLHPRPPEPIRDQDATPRDAELVVMARLIHAAGDRPTVVAGDLNDVAWSATSELFLRLSGLLDPRLGRGLYNSFDAGNPVFRYPLDHVFHSHHFRLVALRRLRNVGSDHFPMLVELSLEADAPAEQPREHAEPGDHAEASQKLREQAAAAHTGDDRPSPE